MKKRDDAILVPFTKLFQYRTRPRWDLERQLPVSDREIGGASEHHVRVPQRLVGDLHFLGGVRGVQGDDEGDVMHGARVGVRAIHRPQPLEV